MADVFVSYQRSDYDCVEPLVEALRNVGWSVWWDAEGSGGGRVHKMVQKEIDEANSVLVVWSARSVESDWVVSEADEGRKRQILVPVTFDDTEPPIQFRQVNTISLAGWQGSSESDALTRVIAAIEHLAPKPDDPPPIDTSPEPENPPAPPWYQRLYQGISRATRPIAESMPLRIGAAVVIAVSVSGMGVAVVWKEVQASREATRLLSQADNALALEPPALEEALAKINQADDLGAIFSDIEAARERFSRARQRENQRQRVEREFRQLLSSAQGAIERGEFNHGLDLIRQAERLGINAQDVAAARRYHDQKSAEQEHKDKIAKVERLLRDARHAVQNQDFTRAEEHIHTAAAIGVFPKAIDAARRDFDRARGLATTQIEIMLDNAIAFINRGNFSNAATLIKRAEAVGLSPDRLGNVRARYDAAKTENALALTASKRIAVQRGLKLAGHSIAQDGEFGKQTREALADWQSSAGFTPTGYLTKPQYQKLATVQPPEPEPPRPEPPRLRSAQYTYNAAKQATSDDERIRLAIEAVKLAAGNKSLPLAAIAEMCKLIPTNQRPGGCLQGRVTRIMKKL